MSWTPYLLSLGVGVAKGASEVPNAEVSVKHVPEIMSDEAAKSAGVKTDQSAETAKPAALEDYGGIIFSTPTRFGSIASQLDQTGALWMNGKLTGISEVRGGSPYGAAMIAGPDGSRMPREKELKLAADQGRHVAQLPVKLTAP